MTMTDPIADMLTRLRNANSAYHETVAMPYSKLKANIAEILQAEGYIRSWEVADAEVGKTLTLNLKFGPNRERSLAGVRRVSKPGLRVYAKSTNLPRVLGGLGGFMARRMGGDAGKPTYPTTRTGGMTGQYLDIALHNSLKPGVEAQDVVPAGLKLGKSLTLTPIGPREEGKGTMAPGKVPDIQVKITEYWGCGASVRPGQPKVATFKLKGNGKTVDPNNPMGAMQGIDFQAPAVEFGHSGSRPI